MAAGLVTYSKEIDAVRGCNGGGVVWVDKTTGEYVYKGSPYYGKAGNAVYACEMDVLRNGGHAHTGK